MKTKNVLDNTQSEAMQTTLDVQIDTQLNIARTIVLELTAHPERCERLAEQLDVSLQLIATLRKYELPVPAEEQTNDLEGESKEEISTGYRRDISSLLFDACELAKSMDDLLHLYADDSESKNDGNNMYRVIRILGLLEEVLKKCYEQY